MITSKECSWCGEIIMDRSTRQNRRFCDATHRTLWHYHNNARVNAKMKLNSLKQSKLRRTNPKAILKQKIYFDKWRKTNKLKFNRLCRNSMRKKLHGHKTHTMATNGPDVINLTSTPKKSFPMCSA